MLKFIIAEVFEAFLAQTLGIGGGKGITFYTLDRLISEKAIFGGKVIQYNFLGSIITFSGDSESAEKTPYNFFCQKFMLYNFLWSNITFDEIITFFVEKLYSITF